MFGRQWIVRALAACTTVVAAATAALPACAADADLNAIIQRGELRVGMINQPNYAMFDPNTKTWSGANFDIAKRLADVAGVKLTIVESNWQGIIPALQAGQTDIAMAPFYATPKRALSVWFSEPYNYDRSGILIRKEDAEKFKTMADLNKAGITFAAHVGSASEADAKRFFPEASVKPLSTDTIILELQSRRVEAWISDMTTISLAAKRNSEWATVFSPDTVFNAVPVVFVMPQGAVNLQQYVNASLQYYKTQGVLDEILAKWDFPPMPSK